jgi:hypothetical protein
MLQDLLSNTVYDDHRDFDESAIDALIEGQKPVDFDPLGSHLKGKWEQWKLSRREIEEEWLKDLRAFSQKNEADVAMPHSKHKDIYFGITRTKCLSTYARVIDLIFHTGDEQWTITSTPTPENPSIPPDQIAFFEEEMAARTKAMQTEMEDQLLDMKYEDKVKSGILESCIIGTGAIKGVIPGVKKDKVWAKTSLGWDVMDFEEQVPEISDVSVFDLYPDPYANCSENLTGIFERHVLTRNQLTELKNNPQFDSLVIDEILKTSLKGNHSPEFHEVERRAIAGINDTSGSNSDRYDVLEFWGQLAGELLSIHNIPDVEETEMYWVNAWTCNGRTLLAKIMPMKKQRIPYSFFIYAKVPHQFWGCGPAKMMRHSQYTINGSIRALLDNMSISSLPQVEVNINMLKDGEKSNEIYAGKIWQRNSGDPSDPAVRFYYPPSKAQEFINVSDQFRKYADEETALPSYTHGDEIPGLNKTASGMSMLMGAAQISIKSVIKNIEDYGVRPLLESLYDWNMQWSDKEEIKGDMSVDLRISSSVIAKEQQSEQLIRFSQLTANPIDMQYVDRVYLLREIANTLDIDASKAIPDRAEINGQDNGYGDPQVIQPPGMALPGNIVEQPTQPIAP